MKRDATSPAQSAHFGADVTGIGRRFPVPRLAVAALGCLLVACASFDAADLTDTASAAPDVTAVVAPQDGPVFEGSAPEVPGSHAKLVLEKNFQQTRKLRWESDDPRIGAAEVDFFEPREWQLEGDPPHTLTFVDRSPGPILSGTVLLAPHERAVVNVRLGNERVTYRLEGVEATPSNVVGMVLVPAGPYLYDCNEAVYDDCDWDELPGSTRTLPSFYIDRTEVSVAEYRECVEVEVCTEEGLEMTYWQYAEQPQWAWACNWNHTDREQHPINCVDFEMAAIYCSWRGKRLPSQEEWQKAARGTDGWTYPWGNDGYSRDRLVANIADDTYKRYDSHWKTAKDYDDGYLTTAPVGSFPEGASPYGALDMVGNVWEWTGSYPVDQEGKEIEDRRWTSGGAFDSRPQISRVTYHFPTRPGGRFSNTGMRCAVGIR